MAMIVNPYHNYTDHCNGDSRQEKVPINIIGYSFGTGYNFGIGYRGK